VSSPEPARIQIDEAAAGIIRATEVWDAADIQRIDGCREALETAATAMSGAQEILLSNGGGSKELAARAAAIKADTIKLERLVDGASALLRTAFPEMSQCAPVYGRTGTIATEPPSGRGLEG